MANGDGGEERERVGRDEVVAVVVKLVSCVQRRQYAAGIEEDGGSGEKIGGGSRKGDKQGESERKEEGVKSPECGDNGRDVG